MKLAIAVLSTSFALPSAAQCPDWGSGFQLPGIHAAGNASGTGSGSGVEAAAVFDDGSGPALYLAGGFVSAGGAPAQNVVRWDGQAFEPVGAGLPDVARALCVFDDGAGPRLYAAGGLATPFVERWDGSSWSPVGSGSWVSGSVRDLAVYDDGSGPALYATGSFIAYDVWYLAGMARWNGTEWVPLPGGGLSVQGYGRGLTVFDAGSGPELCVTGSFTTAGGVSARNVARFDGSTWSAFGAGLFGEGWAFAAFEGRLVAGGDFLTQGSVVEWDGASWSPLGGVTVGGVSRLLVHDEGAGPVLFAGGKLKTLPAGSGPSPGGLARWDGASWSALGQLNGQNREVRALCAYDEGSGGLAFFAGGWFDDADGLAVENLVRVELGAYSAVGEGDFLDDAVRALASHDDGSGAALYAGGLFQTAGGAPIPHVARWRSGEWEPVGAGLPGPVYALVEHDDGSGPALFAGGDFPTLGSLARWDGSSWTTVGGGTSGRVWRSPRSMRAAARSSSPAVSSRASGACRCRTSRAGTGPRGRG